MTAHLSNFTISMASISPAFIPIAVVLLALLVVYRARSPWRLLPPGPKGLPVLGNLLQFDNRPWLSFTRWGEKYGRSTTPHVTFNLTEILAGALLYLQVFGRSFIVINNLKTAADLMDRRSIITGDRPATIVANIMTGGLLIPFINHNNT